MDRKNSKIIYLTKRMNIYYDFFTMSNCDFIIRSLSRLVDNVIGKYTYRFSKEDKAKPVGYLSFDKARLEKKLIKPEV